MATIQRPTKEGSVHTYQEKVGLGFIDILASEMDADLDTIYAAWNGGIDSVTLNDLAVTTPKLVDGAVTYAKLGPDAQLWRDTGTALTPGTNFASRNLSVAGTIAGGTANGPMCPKVQGFGTGGYAMFSINDPFGTPGDPTKSSWALQMETSATQDAVAFRRRAPNGAVGTLTDLLAVSSGGVLTAGSNVQIIGSAAGVRCQNVGSVAGDGYSNAVAFGWDGTLKVRIDGVQYGTVTVTSDARVKLDVQEDVPGLDTVLALRPVSFEYDQAARPIGFEPGRHYGLVAQEVAPHLALLLREEAWDSAKPDETRFALQYVELIPVLIQAIKDLAARVALLEAPA